MPTVFDGVTYRSRTEARWAVFFDRLGVSFEYEPRQIQLSDGRVYTPDFYIKDFDVFVEVKPDNREIILEEADKALLLYEMKISKSVWLVMGAPDPKRRNVLDFSIRDKYSGLVDFYESLSDFFEATEIRSMILEDRRDDCRYWLKGEGEWDFCYAIGGPGIETDHDRGPILHQNVAAAYKKAMKAFQNKKPVVPWQGCPFKWH
ncbi:hypothetical protein [Rhodobacter sp. JA431]|uniref:hypothetical protein n=1 Tax=Rhodobacter sp. JA431 TaxID=570013 RepID=UPI000BE2EAD1|nr:hypothetical protein [Rhodobacter sp. JA431]